MIHLPYFSHGSRSKNESDLYHSGFSLEVIFLLVPSETYYCHQSPVTISVTPIDKQELFVHHLN